MAVYSEHTFKLRYCSIGISGITLMFQEAKIYFKNVIQVLTLTKM